MNGKLLVEFSLLYEDEYLYSFCIEGVYGDYYMTDPVNFYVGEETKVMIGY